MSDEDLDIDIEDFDDQTDPAEPVVAPETEPVAPTRGSSVMLKIVILFVIVAAGGGVYLTLFGHGVLHHRRGAVPAMPRHMAQAQHHSAFPQPIVPEKKTAPPASGGALPVVSDQPPSAALLAPAPGGMPSPTMPVSSAPASPFGIPGQQPAATAGNAAAAPVPPAPMAPLPSPEKSPIEKSAVAPAIAVPAINKIADAKTGGGAAESAIKPAADETTVAKSTQAGRDSEQTMNDSDEVKALKKKITLLENTIKQLQQAPVVAKPAPHKSHHHIARRAARHAVRKARHPADQVPVWVLKAAKPGEAWVARKGSGTLQRVKPGDSLAGIGRVKLIIHDSFGAWVVVGTKGRISQ